MGERLNNSGHSEPQDEVNLDGELTQQEKRNIEALEFLIDVISKKYPQLHQDLIDVQRILSKSGRYYPEIQAYSAVGQGLIDISKLLNGEEQDTTFQSLFSLLQKWYTKHLASWLYTSPEDRESAINELIEIINEGNEEPFFWDDHAYQLIEEFVSNTRKEIENPQDRVQIAVQSGKLANFLLELQPQAVELEDVLIKDQLVTLLNKVILLWREAVDDYADSRSSHIINDLDDDIFNPPSYAD